MRELSLFSSRLPIDPISTASAFVAGHVSPLIARPHLVLVRQTSPRVEKYAVNGVSKNVHHVVKNQPFELHVRLTSNMLGSKYLDLNDLVIKADLFFDTESERPVTFVSKSPLEYRVSPNELGTEAVISCKLHVLSSQLEDMYFKIRLQAMEKVNGNSDAVVLVSPSLVIFSDAIRSRAKPDKPRATKRSRSEPPADSATLLNQQQKLIESLISERQSQCSFEALFESFVNSYSSLPTQDRPGKIRRLLAASSSKTTENFSDCVSQFASCGLDVGSDPSSPSSSLSMASPFLLEGVTSIDSNASYPESYNFVGTVFDDVRI